MNLTVLGLWHLGSVTSACAARHFDVTGLDFDEAVVAGPLGQNLGDLSGQRRKTESELLAVILRA